MPTLQPWHADHGAAGAALRRRAQPLLPPRRQRAGSSCPISTGSSSRSSTPSWSRSRPAPARPTCSPATCSSRTTPSSRRASSAAACAPLPVAGGARRASGAVPQPERQGPGLARPVPRPALPRGAVAGHRPRAAQPVPLFRPGAALEQLDHPAEPAVSRRVRRSAASAYDPEAANQMLDELGLDQRDRARHPAAARRPADGAHVETAGEDTEQIDVLELVARPVARDRLRHPRQAVRPRDAAQPRSSPARR